MTKVIFVLIFHFVHTLQSISPGAVRTEIFKPEVLPLLKDVPMLDPFDVSQAVLYAIATPPHVQVMSTEFHSHILYVIFYTIIAGARTHYQASWGEGIASAICFMWKSYISAIKCREQFQHIPYSHTNKC